MDHPVMSILKENKFLELVACHAFGMWLKCRQNFNKLDSDASL